MRKASLALGLCGGVAGIAVHAVLLTQAPSAPQRPATAIALGVAGVAAALAGRTWPHTGAVFLLSLGALGLLPNPLTWLPAGVPMMGAGACALVDLRGSPPQPVVQNEAAAMAGGAPGGAPLHWSVAPQARRATTQKQTVGAQPCAPTQAYREAWSPKSKTLAAGLILAAAAAVVPLSWWSQDSVASAVQPPTTTSVTAAAALPSSASDPGTPDPGVSDPSDVPPSGLLSGSIIAAREEAAATTTTLPATFDRIGPVDPADPEALVLFSDVRFGLTVALPSTWAEVPGSVLADNDPTAYRVATFADIDGPRHQEAFLNGITVDVLAGSHSEDPPPELAQQSLQQVLDSGPAAHEYYSVLEPIHEVEIGGAPGLSATVRLTWNERVMVKALYVCIANHCLYLIGLQTDDVDWSTYEPLFDQVLESVAFEPASS